MDTSQSKTVQPFKIIDNIYKNNSRAKEILLSHSISVADKAVEIASNIDNRDVDIVFVKEAALLHDVGIINTDAPMLYCFGNKKYIEHGIEGRKILQSLGLLRHALVCERHIGVGLFIEDIIQNNMPLPKRNMVPISIEEKIVCLADKFFSKSGSGKEFTYKEIEAKILSYGDTHLLRLNNLALELNLIF